MRQLLARVALLFVLLWSPYALAQLETSYHGCTDAAGRPVVSGADPAAAAVVGTAFEAGRPSIRYNRDVLPRLPHGVRLFFYAHECARHNLGLPLDRPLDLAQAQRADCWGLESLMRSGLLSAPGELAALQEALRFTAEEWTLLPGPPRAFDLPSCQRRSAARPSLARPPAGQDAWNSCVRVCGERLRACRGPACGETYERCVAQCNGN